MFNSRADATIPSQRESLYIVKPGDTIFMLARENNIPMASLIAANRHILDPYRIMPGQKLCIPLNSDINSGKCTFYNYFRPIRDGGHCTLDPIPKKYEVAALNKYDYNDSSMCGAYLEVTSFWGTTKVLIVDSMGHQAQKGDIDLDKFSFNKIFPHEEGTTPIYWRIVALDFWDCSTFRYRFDPSSTQYWMSVQIRNHLYPIKSLEYKKNNVYIPLKRQMQNCFFSAQGNPPGPGPYTFRVTDIFNQTVIDENIKMDKEVIGKSQFPLLHRALIR